MKPEKDSPVVHEVDGIEEMDNKLPNWWLGTLFGAIAFAAVYWFAYHGAHMLEWPIEAYRTEVERETIARASSMKVGEATPEALVALTRDPGALAIGKQVFVSTCAPCHRADGGGSVGPNLTDEFWLHGAAPEKIYGTIANGVSAKGMPAWQAQLGPLKTQAVTAYVLQLRGTNAPNGKAPQGERESLTAR